MNSAISPPFNPLGSSRNIAIAGGVSFVHIAALWALQAGFTTNPPPEKVVEVEMLSELIEPPAPLPMAPPPTPKAQPPKPSPAPPRPAPRAPAPRPLPVPLPVADATPASNAPVVAVTPPTLTPPAATAPPAPTSTAPAPPTPVAAAQPRLELPSSDANYLQNPKPAYPAISRRLSEQGKVLLRVLIGVDGSAQKVELQKSSGFDRLDQAAMTAVAKWRFVPGKRNGVAEAMAHTVPVSFSLE